MYPFLVGGLLGLLQSGLFFALTFTLSAGFSTYLLITICWLTGGVAGATYVKDSKFSLRLLLLSTSFIYVLCISMVNSNPFNTQMWPIYGCLIGFAGIYPGVFFARMSAFVSARMLLFWENNGFIVGLVISTLLFTLFGQNTLWALTVFAAMTVWYLSPTS